MTNILNEPHISFGSGGGFTNHVRSFHLLEDGRIIEITKDTADTVKVVAEIGKKNAKVYFSEMQKLKLDTLTFTEPGNHYFFLNVKKDTTSAENKIVWGNREKPIPVEVRDFHKKLMENVRPDDKDKEHHKNKQKDRPREPK